MQAAAEDFAQKTRISFNTWLEKQTMRDDSIGLFAKTAKDDSMWPRTQAMEENDEYLLLRTYVRTSMKDTYTVDKIAVFEKAWDEFQSEPRQSH